MKTVDVCLSPDLIHLYDVSDKVVVVVDILRATSCMTAGLAYGVKSITPYENLEQCQKMKENGYLIAGERNGQKVDGFDLGNSPFDYMDEKVKGKKVAVTTTNGTVAIEKSRRAIEVIIGSFLNISAVAAHVKMQRQNVLILCAGWKGKVNLEDSLFAGALVDKIIDEFEFECDAPLLAHSTYLHMKGDMLKRVQNSSHAKRLNKLNVTKDIEYCLTEDEFDIVPRLVNGELVIS
ncbi:MAG: 2-phosphosulfolactate phosphatase [Fulvivirga sp.]|uniref:2-phosphosulfolactate phosphatase n=1 Tax=Fulvivirga sp. TaxID=1931237 RepID=UPI0032F5DDED